MIKTLLLTLMLFGVWGAPPVFAKLADDYEGHLVSAEKLEKNAKDQDAIISSHTRMRDSVGKYYGLNTSPNGTTDLAIGQEMQIHCEEIVLAAKKLKQELLEFAEWHKDQAAKS